MSILSTMFITTALAGSICLGTLPKNFDILQSGKFGNIGYIIGSISSDCGNTNVPNIPEVEVPDTETPDNSGSEEAPELNFAEKVVALVNEERAAVGLHPLTINEAAMSAALVRSKEIKQSFSHTRPNGSSFSTALKEQGISYRGSGENIAYGQRSPEEVMKAWMNSSGHRANILNEKFTSIGVGCYEANGVLYWTQLFIY